MLRYIRYYIRKGPITSAPSFFFGNVASTLVIHLFPFPPSLLSHLPWDGWSSRPQPTRLSRAQKNPSWSTPIVIASGASPDVCVSKARPHWISKEEGGRGWWWRAENRWDPFGWGPKEPRCLFIINRWIKSRQSQRISISHKYHQPGRVWILFPDPASPHAAAWPGSVA